MAVCVPCPCGFKSADRRPPIYALPRRFSLLLSTLVHAAPTPACLPACYTNHARQAEAAVVFHRSARPPVPHCLPNCHGAAAAGGEAGSEGGAAGEGRRGVLSHGAGGGRRGAAGQPGARRHPPRAGGLQGARLRRQDQELHHHRGGLARGHRRVVGQHRHAHQALTGTRRRLLPHSLRLPASCSTKCPAGLCACATVGRCD